MKAVKRKRGSEMEVQKLPEEALCRLCLTINKSSEMTDIFQGDKTQLSMRIMACTSLEVTPNDSMSSQLCSTCRDLLDIFYAFRKKCKSSDVKYRRFLRLQSAGKVTSISDLSDDEDDEEYSVALTEFNERQKTTLEESLKQAKEELTKKYEAEKMSILQEEKLRIYREEKQKIQENAMRQIVSTLRQKEKEESKEAASGRKGKVFRILRKPTEAKETEKDDVEFEVIVNDDEKEDSRHSEEDYTISVISDEDYEGEEAFREDVEEREDEETEILYSDDIKSPEVEEVEEFEFLEEKDDDDNVTLVEYMKKRKPQETGQGSSSQSKDLDESQSLQTETDEEKFFYLEVDEETEKTSKFYDAKGDLLIFSCSLCPKTFSREKALKNHEVSHTQRKGYSCSFCEKWFPSNSSRMRHERIHTGEKPFVCGVCGRKFVQKEILKRHVIVHSGEKPFKCNQCDKQFTQKEILRQHVNRKHTENPVVELHKCFLCPKSFCHASGLSRHLLVHAGRTFPCEGCGKEFVDKSALKRHMNTIHKSTA